MRSSLGMPKSQWRSIIHWLIYFAAVVTLFDIFNNVMRLNISFWRCVPSCILIVLSNKESRPCYTVPVTNSRLGNQSKELTRMWLIELARFELAGWPLWIDDPAAPPPTGRTRSTQSMEARTRDRNAYLIQSDTTILPTTRGLRHGHTLHLISPTQSNTTYHKQQSRCGLEKHWNTHAKLISFPRSEQVTADQANIGE
jgi:hypothetical protein